MAITGDEPHNNLYPAYPYFQTLGIPALNDSVFNFRGKFAFVLQLGRPEKTIFNAGLSGTPSLAINVTIYGWLIFQYISNNSGLFFGKGLKNG